MIMAGQYETLSCPFCDKGKITCLYFPSVISVKREKSATFGSKTSRSKSSDTWLVQSGCSFCGKSQEEVEKELKKRDII